MGGVGGRLKRERIYIYIKRAWKPTQVFLLENPMDRNLVGYSPWGYKESDTTEQLSIYM